MNQEETNLQEQEVKILDKNNNLLPKKEKIKSKKKKKKIKQYLFTLTWIYLVIRMTVTDIDLLLFSKYLEINPIWYLTIRFLIISLIVLSIWIKIKNKRFWKNFGEFLLFPIYPGLFKTLKILLWKIPERLINKKKVSLLYNYIEWYFDFFFHFKSKLVKGILFILSFIFIFSLKSYFLIIPIFILSVLQFLHLKRRFNETYEPIKIFKIKLELSNPETESSLKKENLTKQFEKVTEDAQKREKNGDPNLIGMENLLLMNEFSHAFNAKIRDILNRRSYLKSFIWKAIYSFLISMIFFGGINYGLFLLDSSNFKVEGDPSFFDFFYYSFFTIIPDGTDIEPLTVIAKSVRMVGVIVGIFINLLILAVYFSVSNERYKENLEKLVKYTDIYSEEIKNHFKEKYGHEPTEGIKKLKLAGNTLKSIEAIKNLFNQKGK